MALILTSTLGGSMKRNGKRYPCRIPNTNGLLNKLKTLWPSHAKVLFLTASPDDYERNESICSCLAASLPMSGLSISSLNICDRRNMEAVQHLLDYDVLILGGGHVPEQNRFFGELNLKAMLKNYHGLMIAWSAGSMNCAETVYAQPEMDGEAIDPNYRRFIPGLGLTSRMIIPHFQAIQYDIVDGLHAIEDIALPDSAGKTFIALNDGSFIVCENGKETLFGEAFQIRDGSIIQICTDGEALDLLEAK